MSTNPLVTKAYAEALHDVRCQWQPRVYPVKGDIMGARWTWRLDSDVSLEEQKMYAETYWKYYKHFKNVLANRSAWLPQGAST